MADFNKPKIPQPNTPKPSASPTPSPKPTAPSSPTPKLNGGANPKPTAPKVDPVRQKIVSQGFAPRQNTNELSNVSKNVDRDSAIKKAHDGLYNSGKLDLSGNTITKNNVQRIQKELGEDYPEDEIIGWMENNSSFRKPIDYDEATERSKASELFDTNLGKESQPLSSTKQDGDNDDFDEWNNEDNPGSAVVSGRLMNYVRKTLSEDPELSPEFIDKMVKGLYQNSNQADYYKGKMKEDWERRKASKLYDTDLNKNQSEEDFGYDSGNQKDINLYNYLTQTLGHDDMTARGLVSSYKQGKDIAGLPRWKVDQISEGTADKDHWPFNVSK